MAFEMVNNMKKKVSYIPLITITGLMTYSIYIVETSDIDFSYEHYIGLVLILISWGLMKYSVVISKLATFLALFLGVFGQAAFTPAISRYRIGFTIAGIGLDILIQPICLFLIVLFIILNWDFIKGAIRSNPSN
jgi:hypothetical protein